MDHRVVAPWLAFTLYFGAAWAEANAWQQKALKEKFEEHQGDIRSRDPEVWRPATASFLKGVQKIMGSDWAPKGEWKQHLDQLMPKE
jgi:hypothetical protein